MTEKHTITIDLDSAITIMRCFLPKNPNKLRLPHLGQEDRARIRAACFDFTGLVNEETRRRDRILAEQAEKVGKELAAKRKPWGEV